MNNRKQPDYLPSRRQIVAECAAIRRRWSPAERRRRTVGYGRQTGETPWAPPHIFTANCLARVRKIVMATA